MWNYDNSNTCITVGILCWNPILPTDSQQTLLYGIPLGFGEAAAFGQAVNSVQQGVDQ